MNAPMYSTTLFRAVLVIIVICLLAHMAPVRHALGVAKSVGQSAAQVASAAGSPQYAKKEKELRDAGIPTKLSDLARPLPPASLNAGPIYMQLADENAHPFGKDESTALAVIRSTPPTAAEWARARRFVAGHPELVAMSEAAARRPQCVIPHKVDTSGPAGLKFPEYAAMRRATRILSIKSRLLARDGQLKEAVAEETLGFNVAKHANGDMGFIIAGLVKIACDAITMQGLENILHDSHGDPKIAVFVDRAIVSGWTKADVVSAFRNETAMGNSEIRFTEMHGPDGKGHPGSAWWPAYIDCNGAQYLSWMQETIKSAELPYPKSISRMEAIENQIHNDRLPSHLLADIFYPVASSYPTKSIQVESKAAVTRVACAVFIYKSKHGVYPSTLSDADPTAVDPFHGKLPGYRR